MTITLSNLFWFAGPRTPRHGPFAGSNESAACGLFPAHFFSQAFLRRGNAGCGDMRHIRGFCVGCLYVRALDFHILDFVDEVLLFLLLVLLLFFFLLLLLCRLDYPKPHVKISAALAVAARKQKVRR